MDRERRKLVQAYYDDALPGDLLREEQDRIASEQTAAQRIVESCTAQFTTMNANLDRWIDRLTNLHVAYRIGDDDERRRLNQGFFDKLFIVDETICGADLIEPYAQVLEADLDERIRAEQQLTPEELFKNDNPTGVNYETQQETTNEVAAQMLTQIDWHKHERPNGALPVDRKNPATYFRRRGSNLTLWRG